MSQGEEPAVDQRLLEQQQAQVSPSINAGEVTQNKSPTTATRRPLFRGYGEDDDPNGGFECCY